MIITPQFQISPHRNKKFDVILRVPMLERTEAEHYLAAYLLRNIDFFCYSVFNVELLPFQSIILRTLLRRPFVMLLLARGGSKTFLLGIYSLLRCCISPGAKVVLVGSNRRQSNFVFAEATNVYYKGGDKASLLRQLVPRPPNALPEGSTMIIKGTQQQSVITALPLACLAKDTLITTENGICEISSLFSNEVKEKQWENINGRIWSLNKFKSFGPIYFNGNSATKKIITNSGYSIECTPTHKIKVIDNCEIIWKTAAEIKIGDYLPIDRTVRWHNSNLSIGYNKGYVLGAIIGDGELDNPKRISLFDKNGEVIANVKKYTGWDWKTFPNYNKHLFNSKDGCKEWMDSWNITAQLKNQRSLPSKILRADKECMRGCLAGLFDTNSSVSVATAKGGVAVSINFLTSSRRLASDVMYCLLHFGIICRIFTCKSRNGFQVLIVGENVNLFNDRIGFNIESKKNKINEGLQRKTRSYPNKDFLPGGKEAILSLMSRGRFEWGELKGKSCFQLSKLKKLSNITFRKLSDFIRDYSEAFNNEVEFQKLLNLNHSNFFYDVVADVHDSQNITYDISVPEDNTYCANGFISHNSGDKIRGTRSSSLIVDEFALISQTTFETVLKPTGSVSVNPIEKVRRLQKQKELIEAGVITEDDITESSGNQVIVASSASYQFTFMYSLYQQYKQIILDGIAQEGQPVNKKKFRRASRYAIVQIGCDAITKMAPGYLDEDNLESARALLSRDKFATEYGAQFVSDSGGYFPRSMLEACQYKLNEHPIVECKARVGDVYILSIDPSSGQSELNDWFAIVCIKLDMISRIGYIVNCSASSGKGWPYYVNLTKKYLNIFNPVYVISDSFGGGSQLGSLLCSAEFADATKGEKPLVQMTKDDLSTYCHADNRILRMNTPTNHFNEISNTHLKSLFEHKKLWFCAPMDDAAYKTHTVKEIEELEETSELIEIAKNQISLITASQGANGLTTFAMPEGLGKINKKERMRKDIYSATLLGAWGIKEYLQIIDGGSQSKLKVYNPTIVTT